MEDLQSLTQVLTSSVSRNDSSQHQESLEVSRNVDSRHEFKQFRIIQMVACSLYDAFKTACNVHEVHDVHLSLRPALDGRLERVGFNVAFIQSTEERKAIWINVESAIINQQVCSKIVPGLLPSGSPSMRLKRSAGEQPDQPPISERRGILFQRSSESAATFFQGVPAITIPNLHLQRNFCTLIRRRLNQPNNDECIGLLGDNGTCKHLAYIDGHVNRAAMPASLSELIALSGADNTEGMGLYERVRLSKHLATAVLYYHATPWLKKSWRSDDVQFFPDLERPLLQQGQHGFPYIKTSIHEAGPTKSSSQMPEYHHFIRNPVLFGLGIMLLELAYQAPLRELQQPTDLEKGGTQISADYFTAHRLVEQSHRQVSRSFKIMIKKCLHCDFGHDSDFASVDLQEAFHRDIVVGLENLEKVFWDLQLDDPDMA